MYTGNFLILGERSYNLERLFNLREGLSAADDSLPDRLTKTPQPVKNGTTNANYVVPLGIMLKQYYKTRGWDAAGIPARRTLKRLKIEEGLKGN